MVVKVWRGMAEGAKCFARLEDAHAYMKHLRPHNATDRDVAIFSAQLSSVAKSRRRAKVEPTLRK